MVMTTTGAMKAQMKWVSYRNQQLNQEKKKKEEEEEVIQHSKYCVQPYKQ